MRPLAFHAAPPDGEWLNDPNLLSVTPDGYSLYAQHRADAPDYRITNWGSFESDDLLGWRWTGVALPADADGWAYSGSGVRTETGLSLFHTVHDPGTGLQHQRQVLSEAIGWRRAPDNSELSRQLANRRDPYVFAWGGEWRMLLTQSCDWHKWQDDPPSYLVVLASADLQQWREVGRIGPWHPPGMIWEVPVMAQIDGADVLFVSLVDRRQGGATCSVRGWVGQFDGERFVIEPGVPAEGQLIDLGPDYYAMTSGVAQDWPGGAPFVAWAASWNTARVPIWPGFAGGPISIPRRIELRRDDGAARLWSTPWPSLPGRFRPVAEPPENGHGTAGFDGSAPFSLTLSGSGGSLRIRADPDTRLLAARRTAADAFDWSADHADAVLPADKRRLSLFIDGPLVELFDDGSGTSLTAALPGGVTSAQLDIRGSRIAIAWSRYPT